ncbi:2-succinylbenzoyl-CoA synthetase [Melghirimyces profundicolus]|uniref:2-succinylbenzoate--CoA ligase n=1 Tax=Melghirimyces profundicolus TaxID=1242148 RepID=A0A2T6C4V4_9BACL|nr:o-succinylbenzoate--CoA ligase [Melghirimyces profundicolus]PTX63348.1 2-succinylbenzoyl-CoA synthetase [Melghirimyces profundicolus]
MSQWQNGTEMPRWLDKRAGLTPERTAVICGEEKRTFRRLAEEVRKTARRLSGLGVGRGDRVAFLMPNGLHTVTLIHAISWLGAVLVPLNTRLAPREIAWQLEDSGAKVMIVNEAHRSLGEAARKACVEGAPKALSWDELGDQPEQETEGCSRISLDDLHTLMYTSGTTGRPKGVMLTWGNHWWSATASALNLGLDPADKWLAAVPLFHMSGLSILMRSLICGMTAVVHPAFDPARANRAIAEDGVTIASVVGTMLTRMLDELGEEHYPESFRCMLLGGGPAPRPLLERCKRKGVPVFQTYGMTETASQIVTLSPEDSLRKLGSAGKPLFPSELKIVGDNRELAPGEAGEIVVRGPNVTRGYWKREDATRDAIRDGWLYTGDLGYVDEEGFLYVLDRRHDLIISGGENVYPAEVEAVLISHPAVEEAGVTGFSDKDWGQVPVAFVKPKEGQSVAENELLRHCRERLARYKVPVRIHEVEELPKNASNKLLRRRLPELIPGGGQGETGP